jgi:hypothetical protein
MKIILAIALSLVAGVLVGTMSQRPELRRAEQRIAELEDRDCSRRGIGRGLAAALHGQPRAMVEPDQVPEQEDHAQDEDAAAEEDAEEITFDFDFGEDGEEFDEEDLAEQLDLLVTAQDLRRAQARAALVEQADPTDTELIAFDDAITRMNTDLKGLTDELLEQVNTDEDITRHDMMTYAADVLDIMIEADEAIVASLDEDVVQDIEDEAIDPFSHIDPEIISMLGGLDL